MNVMAITYNAKAKITLTSSNSYTCDVTIAQSDDVSGFTGSEMNMDGRVVAFYAMNGGVNYQTLRGNDLAALPFGLKTNADTDYTLTISNVSGTETLTMKDEVTGTVFDLTEGYVYNFTADANQAAITNRFHLYVAPTTPEICHRYGKLQVSGSMGQTVKVLNMDGSATSIADTNITAAYQEISLAGLAAGQYKVEWNSQTLIIDVQ